MKSLNDATNPDDTFKDKAITNKTNSTDSGQTDILIKEVESESSDISKVKLWQSTVIYSVLV